MLARQNALNIAEGMDTLIDSSKSAMDKRAITPQQIYQNLNQLKADLERLVALIKREPER